jgi:bifunctional UDP-N-acetylglucosamine pyrophosphorylase/glucosamine-1-phosphate N-acetyltransferase
MSLNTFAAVILAAGQGTRMKSSRPKVLHAVAGRPMIGHVAAAVGTLGPARIVVVTARGGEAVADAVPGAVAAVQDPPLGTGHAVLAARPALQGFDGDILVLFGDTPLVTAATLKAMLEARRNGPAVVVMGFRPADPAAYGRLVTGPAGLERIVEFKDASLAERAIGLCNAGVMALDGRHAFDLLAAVGNANAKGEFYLTDVVEIARQRGLACAVVEADAEEVLGINSRLELAGAEAIVQRRLRRAAMEAGATLLDPDSVHLCHDTVLGRDVVIEPNVFFGPGVVIGDDVVIRGFSHLEGARVAAGATIGPFARLRPGAVLGEAAHIGNFVEVKAATVEPGAKVNHLTYIGDARIGAKANIGAGTITCNYDGFGKYHTDIGAGAFIGSNSALVAPVRIGDNAIVGAGSTITQDVPAGAVTVVRGTKTEREGAAARFRDRARARKAAQQQNKKG